jgi:hypothetical protein
MPVSARTMLTNVVPVRFGVKRRFEAFADFLCYRSKLMRCPEERPQSFGKRATLRSISCAWKDTRELSFGDRLI